MMIGVVDGEGEMRAGGCKRRYRRLEDDLCSCCGTH